MKETEAMQIIEKEKEERIKECKQELGILLKKFSCSLIPFICFSGKEITSDIKIVDIKRENNIPR